MPVILKPLHRQVIVLTGASSGIGLATAHLAAQRGAKLVLVARSADTLAAFERYVRGTGGDAMHVVADVADRELMRGVAQAAVTRYGRIDSWINVAGVSIFGRLDEVSDADARRLFDTNFWGVVYGSLAALPHLKASGGALVNVGSELSEGVVALQGLYSASKHAVKGFTDALRVETVEVDKAPVSITLIQPTAVNTPYAQRSRNYMDREPKLPPPSIDPSQVAEAILKAAVQGGRDVKVGAMATLDTLLAKFAPALFDWAAGKQAGRQQRDAPPRAPQGTLFAPGPSGRMRGDEVD